MPNSVLPGDMNFNGQRAIAKVIIWNEAEPKWLVECDLPGEKGQGTCCRQHKVESGIFYMAKCPVCRLKDLTCKAIWK